MCFAFLAHGLLDFFAVYLALQGVSTFIIELLVLGFALAGLWYMLTAKKRFKTLDDEGNITIEDSLSS